MKIVLRDNRVLEGTPLEIVCAMQALAFGAPRELDGYIAWIVGNARKLDGVELSVDGADPEARATSLVTAMCAVGLARVE